MNKSLKKLPEFKSDAEFGQFVLDHDMSEYFDLSQAERKSFVNLKRSGHIVPIALQDDDYSRLNKIANDTHKPVSEIIGMIFRSGLHAWLTQPPQ